MIKKQLVLNNHLITYYTEGKGITPIIFLHGWRSEAAVWQTVIHALCALLARTKLVSVGGRFASNHTLYALDLPGFGQSETPHYPFTLHDYAEIVKEFIKLINLPTNKLINLSIIGHSFGARIALKLAAEHPTLLQKLILVDCGGARGSNAKRKALTILAKIVKPFFTPRFMQPLRRKIYRAMDAEDYIETPKLQKTYLNIINKPLEPLFPRIQTPTLIIWGEKDKETPLAYGQKIHRAIDASRFAVIKNAGHFCFLDQPKEFIRILEEFLKNG